MTDSTSPAPKRWYQALAEAQSRLSPHALATVVTVAGSAPRGAGTKMLITPDALHDSLGGGRLEQLVVEHAREMLNLGRSGCHLEEIALGQHAQQCCGGHIQVLIELFPAIAPRLALFGAGHVGQAIVNLLAPLGWQIDWLDSRIQQLEVATLPAGCDGHVQTRTFSILDSLHLTASDQSRQMSSPTMASPPIVTGSHVLVLTHDHVEDQALVAALAPRQDLASLGLIGSSSKWARFRQRLRGDLDEAQIARIRCPIGVPGIPGKRPEEIAIGVVAELLQIEARRQRDSSSSQAMQSPSLDSAGLTRQSARRLRARFADVEATQSAVTRQSTVTTQPAEPIRQTTMREKTER